jgi:hypothetical protein
MLLMTMMNYDNDDQDDNDNDNDDDQEDGLLLLEDTHKPGLRSRNPSEDMSILGKKEEETMDNLAPLLSVPIVGMMGSFSLTKNKKSTWRVKQHENHLSFLWTTNCSNTNSTTRRQKLWAALVILSRYTRPLGNILAWYYTNGMNGISMQSYASVVSTSSSSINDRMTGGEGNEAAGPPLLQFQFWSIWTTTCAVTCQQLLCGALLGRILLWGLNRNISWSNHVRVNSSPNNHKSSSTTRTKLSTMPTVTNWHLSFLHGIGSLATNLGFMYGKASLIQVLKLLEPFETLALSQLFFRDGTTCSLGILSSMLVVVGSAMSLIHLQSSPPAPQAIIFAIVSGLTLSTRNVLQRKHHHHDQASSSSLSSSAADSASFASTMTTQPPPPPPPPQRQTQQQQAQQQQQQQQWSKKLEQSIIQFTQLSFEAGISMGCLALASQFVLLLLVWFWNEGGTTTTTLHPWSSSYSTLVLLLLRLPPLQVLLWHPLYNVFSMITLGFCSALTHSLLNAGKRVFAISMALLWFSEGLNPATLMSLVLVAVGGVWYCWEQRMIVVPTGKSFPKPIKQQQQQQQRSSSMTPTIKPLMALLSLYWLYYFQQRYPPS